MRRRGGILDFQSLAAPPRQPYCMGLKGGLDSEGWWWGARRAKLFTAGGLKPGGSQLGTTHGVGRCNCRSCALEKSGTLPFCMPQRSAM
ncbi:hypothetical protein VTK56DRAFT_4734 [Thermocarpiscus australiensis]